MTEVNGLRLAYRGLVAGLAGGYIWLAAAMLVSGGLGDPLAPLRLLGALAPAEVTTAPTRDWVLPSLAVWQLGAGGIGIGFAYFFARYFTVRATLALASVAFAVLAWLPIVQGVNAGYALLPASILYGATLGLALPTRGEVLRRRGGETVGNGQPPSSGSPVT